MPPQAATATGATAQPPDSTPTPDSTSPPDPKAQVRRILEHPDFYQLEPKNQKALLGQIIPSFSDLSDINFDNMIEKIAPEAYAVNKRSGPAQVKVQEEPATGRFWETGPTATRVEETVSSAVEGVARAATLPGRLQTGQVAPYEGMEEAKSIGKGLVSPLLNPPTAGMNEFFERHPEVGGPEQQNLKAFGTMANYVAGIFGGDPDQAWRDWSAGMWGPGFASLLTGPALTYAGGKALKGLSPEGSPAMSPRETAVANERLASLLSVQNALGDKFPDRVAVVAEVRPMLSQALNELGISDKAPLRDRVGAFFGDKAVGSIQGNWTGAFPGRRSILGMHRLEAEPVVDATGQPRTNWTSGIRAGARRTLDVANKVVDIAQRPFDQIVGRYGEEGVNDIKPLIVQDLSAMAADANKMGNKGQANALLAMQGVVKEARNIQELNQIKVNSNKMIQDALGGTPGQQIGQTAENIYAWRLLGDAIRDHMYSKLQKLSGVDLQPFGQRERAAIIFRDGLYGTYLNDVDPSQATSVAKGYLGSIEHGSLWERHIIQRAGRLTPEPAGQYNQAFRKGLGKVGEGGKAEGIEPVPFRQMRPGLPPSESYSPPFFEIPAGIPEEFLHGPSVVGGQKRYAGQQIIDIPEEPRSRYPQAEEDAQAAERDRRQADQFQDERKAKIAQLQTKLDNLKLKHEEALKQGEKGTKMVAQRDEIEKTRGELMKAQFEGTTAPTKMGGQDPIIAESIRLAREELKDAPKDKSGTIPVGLMERARDIEKRLRAEQAKGTPPVEETHSPMEGGSRTAQRREIGTTEGTVPESIFKRSKAKRRQDEVGTTGPIAPDKVYTGRPQRSMSRWQFITGPEGETQTVSTEGGGAWRTNDPLRAFEAYNNLNRWISGKRTLRVTGARGETSVVQLPQNMVKFKDLPPAQQRIYRQYFDSLGEQLKAYQQYQWGRERVKVTPYEPGIVKDPYRSVRRAGTYAAGQQGRTREAEQEDIMHELLEESKAAEQAVQ